MQYVIRFAINQFALAEPAERIAFLVGFQYRNRTRNRGPAHTVIAIAVGDVVAIDTLRRASHRSRTAASM